MRNPSAIFVVAGLAAALAAGGPAPARAEENPSANDIINALTPRAGATRGIRPVTPDAPSQPTPSQATPAAPASAATPIARPHEAAQSVSLTVEFPTGSARLTAAAEQTLSELGRALSSSALASSHFRIEGHTDTVGRPEANRALSLQRAQSVIAFLTASFGISPGRLEAVGMGQEGLRVPTPPNTPEARNRRVQVINLGT